MHSAVIQDLVIVNNRDSRMPLRPNQMYRTYTPKYVNSTVTLISGNMCQAYLVIERDHVVPDKDCKPDESNILVFSPIRDFMALKHEYLRLSIAYDMQNGASAEILEMPKCTNVSKASSYVDA